MKDELTNAELREIQDSARVTEERGIQFNRAEDVPKLLAHIAAQADEIAALKSSLEKLRQWIAALQARVSGGSD